MFSAQNWMRKYMILIYLLQSSYGAFLRCYNGSLDEYLVTPLNQPLSLSPCINTGIPTVIYTFGYRGRTAGPATTAVLTAYITKKKRNVILLDWEEEAKSGVLGIPFGYALYAVPNAKKVGLTMGQALVQLADSGLNMNDIHLVGHSLGAHIMAYAGKYAREHGHVVARITGLDPARALFEGTLTLQTGLDRTCAKFVDIIHTDPGGYGLGESYGTVDIWPNFGKDRSNQPGCPSGQFDPFTPEDLCSHDRAWRYFVESLKFPTAFPAAAAKDFDDWVSSKGQTNHTIYLGDITSTRAKGNFYLKTNDRPPMGMGIKGMQPNAVEGRKRRNPTLMSWLRLFS